jgi:hypothetical protein
MRASKPASRRGVVAGQAEGTRLITIEFFSYGGILAVAVVCAND